MTHQVVVTPNVTGIEGCAYPSADNYDPLATIDIGSCLFDGLCPGDFDNDGVIGIMDILHLLGLYDTPATDSCLSLVVTSSLPFGAHWLHAVHFELNIKG